MQSTAGAPLRLTFLSAIMFLPLIVFLVRLRTADKSDAYIAAVNQDTRPEQLQKRVKTFVQPRPDAPIHEMNMRVHRTPGNLPIVDALSRS
ncbi:MAG: hypothetical protein V3T84_15810 [Phycisphaerales bacterium]